MNAKVKELRLKVPTAFKNVEFFGTNIRRRDQNNDEWRVELQNKVRGAYTLALTWEKPRDAKTNSTIDVAGVEELWAERETRSVVLMTRPPRQADAKSASEQQLSEYA